MGSIAKAIKASKALGRGDIMYFSTNVCQKGNFATGYLLQYCAKVMQVKCAKFVLCLREFSSKNRVKIRGKIRGISRANSLEQ